MKYNLDAFYGAAADVRITQVATEQLDVAGDRREVGFLPGAQVVDDTHTVAQRDEPSGDVRADEAGAARHQAMASIDVFLGWHRPTAVARAAPPGQRADRGSAMRCNSPSRNDMEEARRGAATSAALGACGNRPTV